MDCPSQPLNVATLSLRFSCSEVQGPHVLLSYYVARVISWGPGVLSSFVTLPGLSLWFFRTCLGLRGAPPDIRSAFFCFGIRSSSWPLPRLGALGFSMLCLFLERGWDVLCFRHRFCDEDSDPSLAPRFAGFTVPAQPTRDNRNGRLLYPVQAVGCYLVHLGCASSAMRAVPFCRKV